ncbi:XP_029640472.1uncharacterized protein LOC115215450 [Octopus vulgaris]|uniref:XP_029640472.1uncharacterized protein LOC115215450 n=1 Tax=Octopus vulgaris TaxID=6645 RepID=A0AA36BMZ9_OCTVU|nr:XP_029640472.1uncharacterized protein LOC115215450 [Octopus vulgaris]
MGIPVFSSDTDEEERSVTKKETLKVRRSIDVPSLAKKMLNFAEAASPEERKIDLSKMEEIKKTISRNCYEIKIRQTQESREEIEKRTIIYKTYRNKERKIDFSLEKEVELCLKPIWEKIKFITRGKRYGTVETRFGTEEEAREQSMNPLRTEAITLLPIYRGRRVSRITVINIPPEVDPEQIVAGVTAGLEEKLEIRDATVEDAKKWQGQKVKITIQAEPAVLEVIEIGDCRMAVMVEGRQPRCFTCGKKGHIKRDYKPEEKEKKDEPIKPSTQVTVTATTPVPEEGEGWSQAATKRKHKNPSPEKTKSGEKREVKKAKKPEKENKIYAAINTSNREVMRRVET